MAFLLVPLACLLACVPKQRVAIGPRPIAPFEGQEVRREPPKEEKAPEVQIERPARIERRESLNVQYGIASWYGGEFHGRPTSSGEVYDMFQLTCAHNTLPLGTMVMVTNLENGRSVELRVNDRGPFVKERILDVSYAAARILGMWAKGTAYVKVEWVGPGLEELIERFHVQVGSFIEEKRARDLAEQLKRNFDNVYVAIVETQTQRYHRVRIGPFDTREAALPAAERLSQLGFNVLVTNR
ncbi:MAG: septal ring lytic transglycosylase RlpA family protein [Desulfobacterota bacterium]|nr:septal ring lytic transglycosylase RlpA family protein [Thermodesulfobacteriota bacterium]